MQGWKTWGVLAVPDFRRVWLVGLLVSVARWLEMLVIAVVVWQQTASGLLVATMMLLRLLPMGLFGALLGVAADRVERRSVLVGVLLMQAAVAGGLALLAMAGALGVVSLGLGCFLSGLAWATDNPVRRMMLGEIVGAARMAPAMSFDVVANNASRIAGPVVGGTILAALGPAAAFGVSFLLYAIGIFAALRVTWRSQAVRRNGSVLLETLRSYQLVLASPGMRGILLVTIIFNLFGWPAASMVPVVGQDSFGLGAGGAGLLTSMDGVGALIGAMLLARRAPPEWFRRVYIGGAGLYCLMIAIFALSPSAIPAGTALVAMGVGGAGFATMQTTLVYTSTPPELRSRALGVLSVCVGLGLLGFLQLGLLANWLGPARATAVVGAEGLVALVVTWPWWRVRRETR